MPRIDVVVPCYQYGRYLRACVGSILAQDVADLRVLVIDNASTDDSVEVAQALAAEDQRVEVVAHRRNRGPHASFNEGIDWARGDYFLILCADDMLAPGALRRAMACMERHPDVHLTWGRIASVTADGDVLEAPEPTASAWRISRGGALVERLCRIGRNVIPGPTAVVRTAVQKQAGYYRHTLPLTDDLEVWMRVACHGRVAETDAVQGIARVHAMTQSAAARDVLAWDLDYLGAFESFFRFEGSRLPEARRLRRLARRSLAERAYWGAVAQAVRGDLRLARGLMAFALGRCPDMALLPPLAALGRRTDVLRRVRAVLAEAGGSRPGLRSGA